MKSFNLRRTTTGLLAFAFVAVGTYNSVVVNADGFMDSHNVRFVKRLDEMNGVLKSGRQLANNGEWVKLRAPVKPRLAQAEKPKLTDEVAVSAAASGAPAAIEPAPEGTAPAAIKESLSLELAEVFNAKKYPQGAKSDQFSGTLSANDGVIESISVSLPGNESFSVSFSELTGNVFEYEIDGQTLSGMMYQMDKTSYMVTLTNGPFEGTRLKFNGQPSGEEDLGNNSEQVAENNAPEQEPEFQPVTNDDGTQLAVGSFGNEAQPLEVPEQVLQGAEGASDVAQNDVPAPEGGYGFNFDQQPTTL